jgi:hypothetical protein
MDLQVAGLDDHFLEGLPCQLEVEICTGEICAVGQQSTQRNGGTTDVPGNVAETITVIANTRIEKNPDINQNANLRQRISPLCRIHHGPQKYLRTTNPDWSKS